MDIKYQRHKLSSIFPNMNDDEMKKLTDSIADFGYDKNHPIIIFEGEILDGWHRYQACEKLGVEPTYTDFTGSIEEANDYIIRENLIRRHLSLDDKLKAAASCDEFIEELRADGVKNMDRTKKENCFYGTIKASSEKPINTAKEVAEKFGIGIDGVATMLAIKKKDPETHSAFMDGTIDHNESKIITKLEPKIRDDVLEIVKNTENPKVKDIIKNVIENEESDQIPHVARASGDNEWYTPKEYIDAVKAVMGYIDIDPASSAIANEVVGAKRFYDIEENGLEQHWNGKVWMNPPYAAKLITNFVDKLVEEFTNGNVTEACVLTNNATETQWFRKLAESASIISFPNSRIKYWKADKTISAPLQGGAIFYLGNNTIAFEKEFSDMGVLCRVI